MALQAEVLQSRPRISGERFFIAAPLRCSEILNYQYSIIFHRKGHVLFVIKARQAIASETALTVLMNALPASELLRQVTKESTPDILAYR